MDSNFASYLSTIFFAWTLVSMLGALVVWGFDSQELRSVSSTCATCEASSCC